MKFKILYTLFFALAVGLLFMNNSSGPGAVQGLDRTGSPASPGPCQTCHSGGSFAPTMTLELLKDEEAVTEYVPGDTYQMKVTINASNDPAKYGFQAVALQGETTMNAGAFVDPEAGIQVTTLMGRQYAEHSTPNDTSVFVINWEAPDMGTGEVSFYSAVVAANSNGSSGGDASVFLTNPVVITEGATSSTALEDLQINELTVFPNPVIDQVTLSVNSERTEPLQLEITNINGQTIFQQNLNIATGQWQHTIETSNLSTGIYILKLTDGQKVVSRRIVKR